MASSENPTLESHSGRIAKIIHRSFGRALKSPEPHQPSPAATAAPSPPVEQIDVDPLPRKEEREARKARERASTAKRKRRAKTAVVNLRMSERLKHDLDDLAYELDSNRTELIEIACEMALANPARLRAALDKRGGRR